MYLRAKLFQLIGQRLGAATTGVHDDQHGARGEVRGYLRDQRRRVLARFPCGVENNDTLLGE